MDTAHSDFVPNVTEQRDAQPRHAARTREPVLVPVLSRALDPAPDPHAIGTIIAQRAYPLLLDSAAAPRPALEHSDYPTARYSFAAAAPRTVLRARRDQLEIEDCATGTIVRESGRALDVARRLLGPRRAAHPDLPPFQGGLAGYVGYEYGGQLERIERPASAGLGIADVVLADYSWVIAWDHALGHAWIIAEDEAAMDEAEAVVAAAAHVAPGPPDDIASAPRIHAVAEHVTPSVTRDTYERAVTRIREYIAAGDVFQVNLSQRFSAPMHAAPWTVYRHLHRIDPAPFSAFFDFGDGAIISASPERFLRVTADGTVETRPIKGTRPRGATPEIDRAQGDELLQSEKDAAEHVMIVDVLRNDLARVSSYGTVQVPALKTLESYATVHHLVSIVTGTLRDDADAIDLLHASFPGGSITGAPKVRAMEIIAELEPVTRGVYCGTIGYLSRTGAMDSSIGIRTCVVHDDTVTFSAGGGVVYDSDPALEYQETLDKARALMHVVSTLAHASTSP